MSGASVISSLRKRPRKRPGLDWIDVGEPGQVADDRGDARAAATTGRQQRPRRRGPAHLDGDLAGELEQLAVQEEEAGELELRDHPQLLLEPAVGLGPLGGAVVALAEAGGADLGQLPVGLGVLGAGVAVAEVAGQVEAQPLGQPRRSRRRPPGGRRSARPSALRRRGSRRRCRAARARSIRACRAGGWRRARPEAAPGGGRGSGRCPWRPSGRRALAASSLRRRLRVRSPRHKGRCSSTRNRSAPKAASRRRPSRSAPALLPRAMRPARAPSRAQPERQTSPSTAPGASSSSGSTGGRRSWRRSSAGSPAVRAGAGSPGPFHSRVRAWAIVSSRQRFV